MTVGTLLAAIATVALVACTTSKTVEKEHYSGFLKYYPLLKPATSPSGDPTLRWVDTDLAKGGYTQIYLDKPQVLSEKGEPNKQIPAAVINDIANYADNSMRAALQQKHMLATGPGPHTLHMRTAITTVKANPEYLNWYEYIPIAMVFQGANTAVGGRDQSVYVYGEAQMLDSQSGKVVGEIARKGVGLSLPSEAAQLSLYDVKPLLDKWASDVAAFAQNPNASE